ncbi:S8 family serine peptidase [Streptomyces sp. NPDC051940]|uniref:S8 family serine peptidase n=1 Tax=Streptomyces sp. NPDC051940 TaxID=3155675 RepID=UPI00343A39DA
MRQHRARQRVVLAAVLAAALGVPLLGAVPAYAGSAPVEASALQRKAESGVLADLAAKERVSFWVQLDSQADTSAARKQKDKADKGRAVLKAKQEHADRTQAGLKALLRQAHAPYESYWISNTVKVTGDKALAEKIAARDDVAAIQADTPVELPDPQPATAQPTAAGVEWGVDAINAPEVWDQLGVRGEGVVVASIDTGVEYQHPALLHSYRGTKSDGTVDHAYNWFDATGSCDGAAPCDEHGHGTHTMGTMVGDDGAGNRIGVAPGARWMAAKACTSLGCEQDDLLAAGQWILAPTDSSGQNPRPDLAPDVVNNSWGGSTLDTWYKPMVQAWRDAGIFPAFSNGNAGPDCATAGAPGAYTNTYASGAFDSDGHIAYFSSRGTGEDGGVKPNLAAPGVDIRSSVPGGGYALNSGTSMASPHTAAAVALMWSASPAVRGDVAATEQLLNRTAADADDTTCGGTPANNNVYGEGKLDAFAAVNSAPRGPLGALTGAVTSGGAPLAGATVELRGPMYATATTRDDGTYALPKVMVGDYRITVSKFGYVTAETTATVTEGVTATRDLSLERAPLGTVTGTVSHGGEPEAGARIEVSGAPLTTTTGADGTYTLELPAGTHQLTVTPVSRCAAVGAYTVGIEAGANSRDLALPDRSDKFGTACRVTRDAAFPTGAAKLNVVDPYAGSASIQLPFPVALYGQTYRKASVSVEGYLSLGTFVNSSTNHSLPYTGYPNASLFPFWDNLQLATADGGVYWSTRGAAPHRELVVEWRNMAPSNARTQRVTFAAVIGEDGEFSYHYKNATGGQYALGLGATIGAENADGTDALQYSLNEASISDGTALVFRPGKTAAVSGLVTDANDGKPVAGGAVTVSRGGTAVATGNAGPDGTYLVQVPATDPAGYDITVAAPHYTAGTRTATLAARTADRADTTLTTGRVTMTPTAPLTVIVPADQTRKRTLTLGNTGSAADYTVTEAGGAAWLRATPAAGRLDAAGGQQVELTFDTAGAAPGTVLRGTVVVASESGRAPELKLPVTVAVPAYRAALDAGAEDVSYTDGPGDIWGGDRAYTDGSYGYLGNAVKASTRKTIEGTDDQALFTTARQGAVEYRFDTLPDGVYQVELDFAEISSVQPGQRVFDVMAEGTERITALDIAKDAGGGYRALTKSFTVTVTDGQLNLRLVAHTGKTLVNAVRVTQRPDLAG